MTGVDNLIVSLRDSADPFTLVPETDSGWQRLHYCCFSASHRCWAPLLCVLVALHLFVCLYLVAISMDLVILMIALDLFQRLYRSNACLCSVPCRFVEPPTPL